MPKPGRGRGNSSVASRQSRSTSTGRVKKGAKTNNAAILTSPAGQDGINSNLLHANTNIRPIVPVRSPVRTRGMLSKSGQKNQVPSGSNSGTQQQQQSTTVNIPTRNTYTPLSDEEQEGDDNDDISISSVDDGDDDDDDGSTSKSKKRSGATTTAAKEKRPPPIFVIDTIADSVDELLEGQEYSLKIGKTAVQVITLSKKNFDKVQMVLKLHNVKFYTFDLAQNVPVKIVLQGYQDRPIEDLTQHLADVGVHPRDIKVLSRTTTVTGTHVLYLLYFDRGAVKIQDLRRNKTLDGFWVTWRFYSKNPADTAQCHRCQRFGHGSRHCNLPPKCVKCGEEHFTERCTLPRKTSLGDNDNAQKHKSLVKCANCQGNHTANYRGCAARKNYIEEQEKKKQKSAASKQPLQSTRATPVPKPTVPPGWGRSYASVTAAGSGTAAEQDAVTGENLFTLPEFFSLAGEMMTRFRTCRNKAEQFLALSELMMKYIYHP